MNDEIKEILEQLNIVVNKPLPMLILAPEYTKILLDYITSLQQELEEEKRIEEADLKTIQRLEEENERLERLKNNFKTMSLNNFRKKEDYKTRCEKAIEYINNGYLSDGEMVNILAQNDLLNILQNGSEDDER